MRIFITYLLFLLTVLTGSSGWLSAADPTENNSFDPALVSVERYRGIWEKSPFVAETPALPKTGGLAQRYVLAGMATLQNEPVIFVLDRQSLARLVVTRRPNPGGLVLVSLDDESDPKLARVTIRLGDEQGVIRYDPTALNSVNQDQTAAPTTNVPVPPETAQAATGGKTPTPRGVRVIVRKKKINLSN